MYIKRYFRFVKYLLQHPLCLWNSIYGVCIKFFYIGMLIFIQTFFDSIPCRKIWSGRWSAQARNAGSQCCLSILDRWSIQAWMMIAGLYWLVILAPKSIPMIGRESLLELSRWPFEFIMILIMTIKFKT